MSGTTETCEGHYNDTQRPLPTHHVASVAVDELDHKHVMLCRRTMSGQACHACRRTTISRRPGSFHKLSKVSALAYSL
jgi:hypothetical protein